MKTLVLYSSKYGTTASCANHISQALACDLHSLDDKPKIDLKNYDQIVLGSSVYMGKLRKPMTQFIEANATSLKDKSITFFFCCNETTDYAALVPTTIQHAKIHHLGFELKLSKMGFLDRFITKKVANTSEDISKLNPSALDHLILSMQ